MARSAIPKSDADLAIARNIRRLREAASMSQADLAARMRDAGFTFTPATVSKVELVEDGANQRRVSAAELVAFAQIFEVSLDELATPTVEGSEAFKQSMALGQVFDVAVREATNRAARALYAAEEFRRAHTALVDAGEYDSASAPTEYTEMVAKLDEPVLSALYRLQPTYRTAATGEWTTTSGTEFAFQASSEAANRSWEFGDKDQVFEHLQATGDSLIEDFEIRA